MSCCYTSSMLGHCLAVKFEFNRQHFRMLQPNCLLWMGRHLSNLSVLTTAPSGMSGASGRQSPASHCRGPVPAMWDLWWIEWYWSRPFPGNFCFPCQLSFQPLSSDHSSRIGRVDPFGITTLGVCCPPSIRRHLTSPSAEVILLELYDSHWCCLLVVYFVVHTENIRFIHVWQSSKKSGSLLNWWNHCLSSCSHYIAPVSGLLIQFVGRCSAPSYCDMSTHCQATARRTPRDTFQQ
jgi:hypothetical protein